MATTILEIARRLNISHTTVSRVLNGKSNVFVSDETRQRVLRAAEEMGYRPNLAARSLRESKTNVIAVFSSAATGLWGGINPTIVRGISTVLHSHQYGLFFALSEPGDADERVISSWRFDGAIVLQAPTAPTLRRLGRAREPFVCVNERVEGCHAVLSDDAAGTRLALDHLWGLGHRRIAYASAGVWHLEHYSVRERHDAYVQFLAERGAAPIAGHEVVLPDGLAETFVREAVVGTRATAILAYDHVIATEIIAAAYKLGLRVPQDFSLTCFNDEFPVAHLYPPITVVAPEGEVMGQRGAELLLDQLKAHAREREPATLRLPPRLIVRESTAPVTSG